MSNFKEDSDSGNPIINEFGSFGFSEELKGDSAFFLKLSNNQISESLIKEEAEFQRSILEVSRDSRQNPILKIENLFIFFVGELEAKDNLLRLRFPRNVSPEGPLTLCAFLNSTLPRNMLASEAAAIALDILEGLEFLHDKCSIVLFTLSCCSVFLDVAVNKFKISGFAYAKKSSSGQIPQHCKLLANSIPRRLSFFLAPPLQDQSAKSASFDFDIYSYVVLLFDLMIGHPDKPLKKGFLEIDRSFDLETKARLYSNDLADKTILKIISDVIIQFMEPHEPPKATLGDIKSKLKGCKPVFPAFVKKKLNPSNAISPQQPHPLDLLGLPEAKAHILEIRCTDHSYRLFSAPGGIPVFAKSPRPGRNPKFQEKEIKCALRFLKDKPKHVVQVLGFALDPMNLSSILIVYEYSGLGDLYGFLTHYKGQLTAETKYRWMKEIALGLKAIHNCDIAHRDLKSQNVVLFGGADESLIAKIVDFDLSLDETPNFTTNHTKDIGTWRWRAPEVTFSLNPSLPGSSNALVTRYNPFKADVYSLGCVLYELVFEVIPRHNLPDNFFCHPKDEAQVVELLLKPFQALFSKENMEKTKFAGDASRLSRLISRCVCLKENRATLDEVLQVLSEPLLSKRI